ncbi:MAG: hypothetical protein ACREMY_17380, partial [bacterium]
ICSNRPLLVLSRIFNQGQVSDGTFGGAFDGRVAEDTTPDKRSISSDYGRRPMPIARTSS